MRKLLDTYRRMRWLMLAVSAAIILGLVGGGLLSNDSDAEMRERLRAVGAARASVQQDKNVAQVGEQVITLADFSEATAQVNGNLEFMRGVIAAGSGSTADLQARLNLMEESGVESVALAGLIAKAALYQRAIADGYGATEQEVEAGVAKQRDLSDRGELAEAEGYIQAVGEEYYWSELMPATQRRNIAIEKMFGAVMKDIDREDQQRAWTEFERDAVTGASVKMLDPDAVAPATVESALDYLESYWQLSS